MQRHPLIAIRDSLKPFDPCDLLTTVAALQLMPENADQTLRLEALAQAVASLPPGEGRPRISGGRFRDLCRSPHLDGFARHEDPFNNPFTETVPFHGGSFVVFPGVLEDAAYILRQVIRDLFLAPEALLSDAYIERARQIVAATLALSDEVARRAGLGRGVAAPSRHGGPILVPASERLTTLKRSVVFEEGELAGILRRHRVRPTALAPIATTLGLPQAWDVESTGCSLSRTPLVRTNGRWIVALPGALVAAAWIALIDLARELDLVPSLSQAFQEAVWDSVSESLEILGHRPLLPPMPTSIDAEGVREGSFTLDTDKVLHVILITDSLKNYDPEAPYGEWPIEPEMERIRERICKVNAFHRSLEPPPGATLSLVLTQGLGRSFATHLDLPGGGDELHICMAAAHLETIAMLEGGERLALLKYARSCRKLHSDAHVFCFSELDKYGIYVENEHSFYFGDDERPNLVSIYPDYGGHLRQKVVQKLDWHAAPSHRPNRYTEVAALHGTGKIPLYVERRSIREPDRRPAVLVEGLPHPIWVLGSSPSAVEGLTGRGNIPFTVASTVAYWLWQFTPSIAESIGSILTQDPILIELTFEGDFSADPEGLSEDAPSPVRVETDPYSAMILVTINASLMGLFETGDNSGERVLMSFILEGLRLLLPPQLRSRLSDEAIARCLERHAPLGRKKMILPLNSASVPTLDPSGLPPLRLVQENDESVILDELGDHLALTRQLPIGAIPKDQRNEVLNECARFVFEKLESLVATLDPRGLLEWIIAGHEALLHEVETTRLAIPTRLECFSSMAEMVSRISKELPDCYKASVAARFLIEYVAARPPCGSHPMSLEAYDRLLVLASEIVGFGQLSDTVRYDIADISLAMLPSGRLGIGRDHFERARQAFLPIQAHGEIGRALRNYRRYWRTLTPPPEEPAILRELDSATRAEFAFSLSEIGQFLAECFEVGRELDPVVCRMPLAAFRERFSAALGWPEERILAMLEMLSLGPRPGYLSPPRPFQKEDVYPWRYNRALSYLRRPFLRRETAEGPEILWGPRQLHATHENLLGLCTTGRLRARSPEMKALVGRMLNDQGEAFNDEVAEVLARDERLIVRPRLKKIPSLRGQLEQLGDIDVFVIDPSKRRVFVVECKDLEGARTPFEMSNELTNFFQGTDKKRPIIDKHQGRVRWVCNHLDEVLGYFEITRKGKWKVGSLIVIDRELLTPFLRGSPVPILPLERITSADPRRLSEFLREHAAYFDDSR